MLGIKPWIFNHIAYPSWSKHWKGVYLHCVSRTYCVRVFLWGIDWHPKGSKWPGLPDKKGNFPKSGQIRFPWTKRSDKYACEGECAAPSPNEVSEAPEIRICQIAERRFDMIERNQSLYRAASLEEARAAALEEDFDVHD